MKLVLMVIAMLCVYACMRVSERERKIKCLSRCFYPSADSSRLYTGKIKHVLNLDGISSNQ